MESLKRRRFVQAGLFACGAPWMTAAAQALAEQQAAAKSHRGPATSLIILRLAGGPSQLETFDPHAGRAVAGDTQAIDTRLAGVQLAAGLPRTAELLDRVTLVRNVVSREGDHERGTYVLRTGHKPDATVVHPSIGAICCHQLPIGKTEIPRHVSIFPDRYPARGGFLGNEYDAFRTFDPNSPVTDIRPAVAPQRAARRLADLDVVEEAFAAGRRRAAEATLHRRLVDAARTMMTSEQLQAFDVRREPASVQAAYGATPFGRGCLAARRLIEVGVRCVEVTLTGWDTHVNNHEQHAQLLETLDPALSGLLADLGEHKLLDRTLVVCGGEFGRTPKINRAAGRDHWPAGFSMLLAGGRLRRGYVHGATDPDGAKVQDDDGTPLVDLHATLLAALGIDPTHEEIAALGRPIKLAEGKPVAVLLEN
jgi:uncharacterized protein (DUF1501 family)